MSDDWTVLAEESAADARMYLAHRARDRGRQRPDATLPMALLALSQVLVMGARLGAVEDVVPAERFEPDPGPDAELDPLRESLANVFEGLDEYADVVDPVLDPEPTVGYLSNDLADIASALSHGLSHQTTGRPVEALWWWQFSYLSHWGERAAARCASCSRCSRTCASTPTRTPCPRPSSTPSTPDRRSSTHCEIATHRRPGRGSLGWVFRNESGQGRGREVAGGHGGAQVVGRVPVVGVHRRDDPAVAQPERPEASPARSPCATTSSSAPALPTYSMPRSYWSVKK